MKTRLPLEGYRIVDMTEVWAGPFSTSQLGDLKAPRLSGLSRTLELLRAVPLRRHNLTRASHFTHVCSARRANGRTASLGPFDQLPHDQPQRTRHLHERASPARQGALPSFDCHGRRLRYRLFGRNGKRRWVSTTRSSPNTSQTL